MKATRASLAARAKPDRGGQAFGRRGLARHRRRRAGAARPVVQPCGGQCQWAHAGALRRRRWLAALLRRGVGSRSLAIRRQSERRPLASATRSLFARLDHRVTGLRRRPRLRRDGTESRARQRPLIDSCDQSQRPGRRHREQAPLDVSRGRSRGGNAHCERRSPVRWGPGRNDSLSGRGDRRPRLEARDERGHLGKPPAGRRPALRRERRRHHDRASCRTAKAIAGADRDGCAALFASGADRRCALSGHREAVVSHRGRSRLPAPSSRSGFLFDAQCHHRVEVESRAARASTRRARRRWRRPPPPPRTSGHRAA